MNNLYKDIPVIKRARGWRLYSETGQRLTDLWQIGGGGLLGHTQSALLRELKNTAERGLFAPYPSFAKERFFKALRALFPAAIAFTALPERPQDIPLWRPFSYENAAVEKEPSFAAALPCPLLPWAAVWNERKPHSSAEDLTWDFSPVVFAAAARAVYNLIAAPERGCPSYPKIEAAFKKMGSAEKRIWRRDGIYFYYAPTYSPAAPYQRLFHAFFEKGFLLPPCPDEPLILPGELSPGEETKLAVLLQTTHEHQ
ncbi:MAG: hypothetical protein LBG74_03930 [Spirochaetaceae bacterium]|jgi:hypothetical protein|nr:hypothetical protein [Spirochaetaceae bacterium]